jgi:hypothetical protein
MAEFSGPNGEILQIPGFYNGKDQFIIRFSPNSTGKWHYETISSIPDLAGRQGVIQCTEHTTIKGGMKIDPANPKRFITQDGSPYFLLAFEFDWLFALDLDNPEDFPRSRNLISKIAENGFNHIVMNVYADDVVWTKDPTLPGKYDFGRPLMFPFKGSNADPDFSELNVEFFKRFDRVIAFLNEKNIIAHLMIYVWNKKVNWPEMYSEADNKYFDYVIKRYQAFPNVVWDISKEALSYGRCDMDYVNERIERVRTLDAYNHLLTVHDYQFCKEYPDQVDFISIQTWQSDLYNHMVNLNNEYPDKPVFNIEHGGYEQGPYWVFTGDYHDAETCLARNYNCVFAGVYSTYYWQNTSWNVIVYELEDLEEQKQPKLEYFSHMSDLFSRYDFTDLSPADRSSSGFCLTNDKDQYIYYIPEENDAIHLTVPENEGKDIKVTWFNPYTGMYTDSNVVKSGNWQEFKSYWEEQPNILIIERK